MEKPMEQKWKEGIELRRKKAQLIHEVFTMTDSQSRVALLMVAFGADLDYSVATTLKVCPKN